MPPPAREDEDLSPRLREIPPLLEIKLNGDGLGWIDVTPDRSLYYTPTRAAD